MDYCHLGQSDEKDKAAVLVMKDSRSKTTMSMMVPGKGLSAPWVAKRAAKFIDHLGYLETILKCDQEPAIKELQEESVRIRDKKTIPEHSVAL